MTEQSQDNGETSGEQWPEMNFRIAEFPSDALSVKRFRKLFPDNFDGPGRIADGFSNNDFFYPTGLGEPAHLDQLTELIQDERCVADGAFYRCWQDRYPDIMSVNRRFKTSHLSALQTRPAMG